MLASLALPIPMRASTLRKLVAVVRLGRPKFLVGGAASYAVGVAMARGSIDMLDWRRCILGQVVVTSIQLMTHFSNDYFDYEADLANDTPTNWSGGSRMLPSAALPRSSALQAAMACALVGVACMAWVRTLVHAAVVWWLMSAILLLAWTYSAPPVRLHSRGFGEITAAIVVAALVPWLGFAIQTGFVSQSALLAVLPLVLIQFAMLVVFSVPDRSGDMAVGKSTLCVRIGPLHTGRTHQAAVVLAYLTLPLLWQDRRLSAAATAVSFTLPLALVQLRAVERGELLQPQAWPRIAFTAVALTFVTTVAELVGLVLGG